MFITALLASSLLAAAPADTVIENARIWSDGLAGFAEFAAIEEGRFVHVGDADTSFIGPGTRRIDAGGRVVLPGLIDAHLHMLSGGASLTQLQLRDAPDKDEFVRRIADWAMDLPDGRWILGGRWTTESWSDPQQPTKEWVDEVSGDHPLFLSRMDGHSALADSVALRIAGIDADGPPDPAGGVIDRDPKTGEPTGILREAAMSLVSRHIPARTIDDQIDALCFAMREANRHGITAVGDVNGIGDLKIYERLAPAQVSVRLFLYPSADDWHKAAARVAEFPAEPMKVQINGLKTFVDGTLGSRTAYMRKPFLGNEPGRENWRGLLREGIADGGLARNIRAAAKADLQAIAHCIGDEANHFFLDSLQSSYPHLPGARCRSEHAQHLLPEDIQRFGDLGVIASMQPYHKADDGRYAEDYLGAERCRSSYAFKSLLDAGAVVAFGSDWPVVSVNPFLGVEAAVTGKTLDGKHWQTQENLTVAEALRCYTSRAAYALRAEDEIGRIAPGYRADFIILDRSPFAGDVDWATISPVEVYLEGRLVYGSP
ncbi:MAG: amidohydrolase [Phycisphaerales bacterium]|nr:MAG: amidohydrolase [Phycisphaerales bacterium]